MRPYQIKRSFLFHAIQGKLVCQSAEEGTGRAFLEENYRILQSLPSDIQKRIGKGCRPVKDEDTLFEIPDSWEWERFGNLVINYDSQRKPVTKSDRKTSKGLYDYYGATGAIDRVDEFIFDGEYLMIGEDGGNFFVDRDNSFIARGQFWANNHVHVVRPIVCDISYLKICLDAYDLPNMGLINGIAVPKLNQENMNSILVPVPPLAEQKRIVAKIEELLPLIDRYEAAWSRLEEFNKRFPEDMKKSILQYAIQGKLVEQRPEEGTGEDLYQKIQAEKQELIKAGKIKKEKPLPEITEDETELEIPDSWSLCKLGTIALTITDGEHKTPRRIPAFCGYYLLSARNVRDGCISLQDVDYVDKAEYETIAKRCNPKRGDVLISCSGSVGRCAVVNDSNNYVMVRSAAMVSPVFVDSDYLMLSIQSEYVQGQIRNRTKQTAQANLFQDAIRNLVIPLPPLAEQKRIVKKIEELMQLVDLLQKMGKGQGNVNENKV